VKNFVFFWEGPTPFQIPDRREGASYPSQVFWIRP